MQKAAHQQKKADSLQYVAFVPLLAAPLVVPALGRGRNPLLMTLESIAGAELEIVLVEVTELLLLSLQQNRARSFFRCSKSPSTLLAPLCPSPDLR